MNLMEYRQYVATMTIDQLRQEKGSLESELKGLVTTVVAPGQGYRDPYSEISYGSSEGNRTVVKDERRAGEIQRKISIVTGVLAQKEHDTKLSHDSLMSPDAVTPEKAPERKPQNSYDKNKQIRAERERKEQEREKTFKDIRNEYRKRKGHTLERIFRFVTFQGPKWGQIKKYNQNELDYLLGTLLGTTNWMEEKKNQIDESNPDKNFATLKEKYKAKQWAEFLRLSRGTRSKLEPYVNQERRGMHR